MSYTIEIKNCLIKYPGFCFDLPYLKYSFQKILVIQAPSGYGKTSLVKALMGLIEAGKQFAWYLNEKPMNQLNLENKNIGVSFQEPILFDHLTIYEHLKLAAKPFGMSPQEILSGLNLNNCVSNRANQLSGGQKKRLALGLILANASPFMILDEPFNGLDPLTLEQVKKTINSYLTTRPAGAIIVTHQIEQIAEWADSLIELNKVAKVTYGLD